MLEGSEDSRLFDILGNRNRRRIIELLQSKPCFVTEISERLVLSPKAVIEHLQLMENERILSCYCDERRRKYYFLAGDISVNVHIETTTRRAGAPEGRNLIEDPAGVFLNSLAMLRRMLLARENLVANLEQLEQDIDMKVNDVLKTSRNLLLTETETDLILALAHYDLTRTEIQKFTGTPMQELAPTLRSLVKRGIIEERDAHYMLRGIHAK
ncbi:MAG: ArsR family transcriptional regulator [Methanomicrobiales archaeon]|nr:ArsR family transcriptional regulator [Methanomicrobiales archaeon]